MNLTLVKNLLQCDNLNQLLKQVQTKGHKTGYSVPRCRKNTPCPRKSEEGQRTSVLGDPVQMVTNTNWDFKANVTSYLNFTTFCYSGVVAKGSAVH